MTLKWSTQSVQKTAFVLKLSMCSKWMDPSRSGDSKFLFLFGRISLVNGGYNSFNLLPTMKDKTFTAQPLCKYARANFLRCMVRGCLMDVLRSSLGPSPYVCFVAQKSASGWVNRIVKKYLWNIMQKERCKMTISSSRTGPVNRSKSKNEEYKKPTKKGMYA